MDEIKQCSGTLAVVREQIAARLKEICPKPVQRVLFITPPQFPTKKINMHIVRNRRYYVFPPYGAGVLCAQLKRKGYDGQILDLNYDILSFLIENEKDIAVDNTVDDTLIENMWKERVRSALETYKPDMIGISVMFTMSHPALIDIANYIKELQPQLPIMAGGVHVTNAPKNVLTESNAINFVSLFEGDSAIEKLLNFLNDKAPASELSQMGLLYEDRYIAINERATPAPADFDIIPEYGNLPIGKYSRYGEIGTFRFWRPQESKVASSLSNRGCRARCSFCSVRNFNGPTVRSRSVESVVDELEQLRDQHGITHISWLDDDLFFDPKRAEHLFRSIANRKLGITWDATNGIIASAAAVNPELVGAAAESGCIGMYFGVESGNAEILRRVHKPSGVKHYLKAGEIMKKYPQIFTKGFLIIGFPKETLGQIKDTIQLAKDMSLDWYTTQMLTPLPSTEIYKEMVDLKIISDGSLNMEGNNYSLFVVRESERQRLMEKSEKNLDAFYDFFSSGDLSHVPSREELNNIWFMVDYRINYEKMLLSNDEQYLRKMRLFLADVADRMTIDNPFPHRYLGIVEKRLGNIEEAKRRFNLCESFAKRSKYWMHRFDVLGLEMNAAQLITAQAFA